MRAYVMRRIMLSVPTLIIVTLVVFFSIRLMPGSAIDLILSQYMDIGGEMDRAELERRLGLDKPIIVQYFRWVGDLMQGDLGHSLYDTAYWDQVNNQ
jgi:peptide/nickel transport system permease protein